MRKPKLQRKANEKNHGADSDLHSVSNLVYFVEVKMAEKIAVVIIGLIAMRGIWAIVMDICEILSGEK